MKLTLAMGLQYDNGKSNQMVALTLGRGEGKPEPAQNSPVMALPVSSHQPTMITPVRNNAVLMLTYSLQGLPVPFLQDVTNINLFA